MQIGILPLLGLIFVVLKLTNVIAWSWLWVTSPFWIAGIIFVLWIIVLAAVGGAASK